MFVGTFKLTIDRSRVLLPKEIFAGIGARQVVLFLDEKKRQLVFYSQSSVDTLSKTLPSDPDKLARRMSMMLANGHVARVDNKKRLVIPSTVLEKVGIERNCYLIGQGHFCLLKAKLPM